MCAAWGDEVKCKGNAVAVALALTLGIKQGALINRAGSLVLVCRAQSTVWFGRFTGNPVEFSA